MSPRPGRVELPALGTTATVLTDDAGRARVAADAVRETTDEVDRACSRFREDSELSALGRAGGSPTRVSPVLAEALGTALRAAELTDGLVDPTVATAVRAWGYDVTFSLLAPDGELPPVHLTAVPGWRTIAFDPGTRTVRVPPGVELDLGATAKAWAADRAAAAAAAATGCAVLVSLGGDIAVAGPTRPDGWDVRIVDDHAAGPEAEGPVVAIDGGGLATSSTTVRRWHRGSVLVHHLVDPRTGAPAATPWRTVSVAAATCTDANTASTAAVVLGDDAPAWLSVRGLPARLVASDGAVLTLGGWPTDEQVAA